MVSVTQETRPQAGRPQAGRLQADISNHVVRLFADYTGRGPTKARTTIRGNIVCCVTQDTMTKAERRLVAEGEAEIVQSVRRKFQQTMRGDLVTGVAELTGRNVVAFMSDHDPIPDYASEVFILDGPVDPRSEEDAVLPD